MKTINLHFTGYAETGDLDESKLNKMIQKFKKDYIYSTRAQYKDLCCHELEFLKMKEMPLKAISVKIEIKVKNIKERICGGIEEEDET